MHIGKTTPYLIQSQRSSGDAPPTPTASSETPNTDPSVPPLPPAQQGLNPSASATTQRTAVQTEAPMGAEETPAPASKKQFYDNSCGAACLTCACHELGIESLPDLKGSSMWNGQALRLDNATESAVYQVTSASKPGADLRNAGYSFPENLVLTGRILGLDSSVNMQPGVFSSLLKAKHSEVVKRLEGSNVPIEEGGPVDLQPDQRELRVVAPLKGVGGLHYVMHRPDGTFMDPADGRNFNSFDEMNNSWLKSYTDTGISIIVSRQAPQNND